MEKKQTVDVDFYRDDNLPKPIKAEMEKQGFKIENKNFSLTYPK